MEIWDGYSKDGELLGIDLVRDEAIPRGVYHIVSEVYVRHTDGTYLLMQRDWNKIGYPGLFETGACGSILKGETPLQGAVRELAEETGITGGDMTFIYANSNMINTFYYAYLCVVDCDKDSVTLQEGETISYKWISRQELLEIMETDSFIDAKRDRMTPFINSI